MDLLFIVYDFSLAPQRKKWALKGDEISILTKKNTIDFRRRIRMNNLNFIKKKIELLEHKKSEIEAKEALTLYRKFHKILGEEYSPDLVVGLVSHTWENKSSKLKEAWLQKATSFRSSQSLSLEN